MMWLLLWAIHASRLFLAQSMTFPSLAMRNYHSGTSVEDALLKVTGEQMVSRKADLWIRRVHVEGWWMGGDDFSFKTGRAKFGKSPNYLARMSGGAWLSPRDLLKNGKMSLALCQLQTRGGRLPINKLH